MVNLRELKETKSIRKDTDEKTIKQLSNSKFNGVRESYTNYDSYTFKDIEVFMDQLVYLGVAAEELSKSMYLKHIKMDFNPIVDKRTYNCLTLTLIVLLPGVNTNDIIEDLVNKNDFFDFSNLHKPHE